LKILNKEQTPKKITPSTARITKDNAAQYVSL
jgi:hypothetical protein